MIALRFYAQGPQQVGVADFAGVSISSVCRILRRVSGAFAEMCGQFVKMPSNRPEMQKLCEAFYEIASFPRTIGAIDCTHIKIESPGKDNDPEVFRNRKGYFSINVQTITGPDLKINSIVAHWPGSTHDQRIFNTSVVKSRFESDEFKEFILVGDSGYQNTMYLATPLLETTNRIEELYNESQIRTRNVVERGYGVLKRRFPCLALGLRVHITTTQDIILACAVLHNICIDQRDEWEEEVDPDDIDVPAESEVERAVGVGVPNVRNELLQHYFPRLLQQTE